MMIAKPEWFKRRKKDTLGIFGYPWQSIAYILLMFLLAVGVIFPEGLMTKIIIIAFFYFLFIDGLIAYQKSLDERQILNHAIVYRNAFWGIFITFTIIQAVNFNLNPNYHLLDNISDSPTLPSASDLSTLPPTPDPASYLPTLPPAITYNLHPENIIILTVFPLIFGFLIATITYYQQDKGKLNMNILHKITNYSGNMLIVRSKWFKRKNKSNYWILDIPWQGTVYILVLLLLILLVGSGDIKIVLLSVILLIFMTMNYLFAYQKSLDERQRLNHAIAERNAFWGILITFIIIQAILFNYNLNLEDTYLLIPLPIVVGFLIAVITYYKLQRELLFL